MTTKATSEQGQMDAATAVAVAAAAAAASAVASSEQTNVHASEEQLLENGQADGTMNETELQGETEQEQDRIESLTRDEPPAGNDDLSFDVGSRQDQSEEHVDANVIEEMEGLKAEDEGDFTQASSASALADTSEVQQDGQPNMYSADSSDVHFAAAAAADASGSDAGALGQTRHANTNRTMTHHSKKRRVNTCWPCKKRKVKCDRQKPHCGQCQKSHISAAECTWSAAVDQHQTNVGGANTNANLTFSASLSTIAAAAAGAESVNASANGTQWFNVENSFASGHADGGTQGLLDRIAALEEALATAANHVRSYTSSAREPNGEGAGVWGDLKAFTQSSDAERGMAADALAMIAQQTTATIEDATRVGKLKYKRFFSDSASSPALLPSIKEAVSLLPEQKLTDTFIGFLETIQDHGVYLGVPARLLKLQVNGMTTTQFADRWLSTDLSLVALILYVLAVCADLMPADQVIASGIVDSEESIADAIEVWIRAVEKLLHTIELQSKPNLNLLSVLLLQRHLQAGRGQAFAASVALGSAERLARALGIDKLGSQRDDIVNWSLSSKEDASFQSDVVQPDTLMSPVLVDGFSVSAKDFIRQSPWLSARCTLVREAARHIYAHITMHDWIADPFSAISVSPTTHVPLPLPLEPTSVSDEYPMHAEDDVLTPTSILVSRYLFAVSQKVALWKRDGRSSAQVADVERMLFEVARPTCLQTDATVAAGENLDAVQHLRAVVDFVLQYCLFVVRRGDASFAEQCIDAAERILQARTTLGMSFPSPLHKFFTVQRYTLEAATMVVIYLHQFGAQISEERRHALQTLIDEAYAQPGFEHAHSLLSLNFDASAAAAAASAAPPTQLDSNTSVAPPVNGVKRSVPTEDSEDEAKEEVALASAAAVVVEGGLPLSNGKRLSSGHPIVVGLRAFVNGQTLPFGNAQETLDFWDAIERQSQLFLFG